MPRVVKLPDDPELQPVLRRLAAWFEADEAVELAALAGEPLEERERLDVAASRARADVVQRAADQQADALLAGLRHHDVLVYPDGEVTLRDSSRRHRFHNLLVELWSRLESIRGRALLEILERGAEQPLLAGDLFGSPPQLLGLVEGAAGRGLDVARLETALEAVFPHGSWTAEQRLRVRVTSFAWRPMCLREREPWVEILRRDLAPLPVERLRLWAELLVRAERVGGKPPAPAWNEAIDGLLVGIGPEDFAECFARWSAWFGLAPGSRPAGRHQRRVRPSPGSTRAMRGLVRVAARVPLCREALLDLRDACFLRMGDGRINSPAVGEAAQSVLDPLPE